MSTDQHGKECVYYAAIGADTDLTTARPGYAGDQVKKLPYKFEVRGSGNLALRFRRSAALGTIATTDTVITGIIAPDTIYFDGATHIVSATTTATKITVYWH